MMLRFPALGLLLMFCLNAASQCTIVGQREGCVNDLISFSFTSNSTVSSYSWDFGVYGSSSNTSPLVKFTSQGKVLVSCTATLSNGKQCVDTHSINILPNPIAHAYLSKSSLYCLNENNICLVDSITLGARGIKSVNLLWGDGNLLQLSQPIPKKWCHAFLDTGAFTLSMEVSDSAGCKDKFTVDIRVKPAVKTTYKELVTYFCDSAKYCVTSNAVGGSAIKTNWYSLPAKTKLNFQPNWCANVAIGDVLKLRMIAENSDGCLDSLDINFKPEGEGFSARKIKDILCLNEVAVGALNFHATEEVQWYLNGVKDYIDQKYVIYSGKIGMNYVRAERIGGCKGTYLDSFEIRGVRAVGRQYNGNRRTVQDTVFLEDITPWPAGKALMRLWDFGDQNAERCTTWTAKNINVGRNCNFSRDSLAVHYYSDTDCYGVRLIITDTATGCWDDSIIPIYRKEACSPILLPTNICLGNIFTFTIPTNIHTKVGNNAFYVVDTVYKSDTVWLVNGYGQYLYTTLGIKSPILWRYYDPDTVWTVKSGKVVVDFIRPAKGWVADTFRFRLAVVPGSKSDFKLTKLSNCNPFKVRLKFVDSIWHNPSILTIDWGDTITVFKGYTDTVAKLTELVHEYKTGGLYQITATMKSSSTCNSVFRDYIAFSHYAKLGNSPACVGDKVCFYDTVVDINSQKVWTAQNKLGQLYWEFGDGQKDSGFQVCHQYNREGVYFVKLTSIGSTGCVSVARDTVELSRPLAGIKFQPTIYCSEIRQYFDSSTVTNPSYGQVINSWRWTFGDGTNPSSVKNPAHIFPGGGIYRTWLKVSTNQGCSDSTFRDFTVIGPSPKASIISDTLGCAPLKVDFGNLSKQTKSFIWEFGDKNNTHYSTDRDTNTSFTYKDGGIYYIYLIGGDSFLNPTTGSKYFCSVRYPSAGQKPLRVEVLETAHADFYAPTTVCLGDTMEFGNTSDNVELKYRWNFGNGDSSIRGMDTFKYVYNKKGRYLVGLEPILLGGGNKACTDTALRIVQVVELVPEFDMDCKKSNGNEIYLENKSGLDIPGYSWTLLNPVDSSESQLSTETHLYYNFGKDTGLKQICLGINGGKSCGGKNCKSILVQSEIFFANVFTPGNTDGYNDTYKVPLYGYSDFELKIFNRWGERIFYSTSPNDEWNGRVFNSGPELPTGTYFYQVVYRPECAEKPVVLNGSINLIRN